MRYPPAMTYTPARSRVYLVAVVLVTIILIAVCADFMAASGHFYLKKYLFMGLTVVVSLWLLHDTWKQPRGQLHYSQGQWVWHREGQEIAGTLRLHLDLQNYMLVSFVARHDSRPQPIKIQWFHLEARHLHQAPSGSSWAALRRAVFSQVENEHEAVAV